MYPPYVLVMETTGKDEAAGGTDGNKPRVNG